MQYGLKAKERKEYSFTAPDLGTFIHNILDTFSKNMEKDKLTWRDISEDYIIEQVSRIVPLEVSGFQPKLVANSNFCSFVVCWKANRAGIFLD